MQETNHQVDYEQEFCLEMCDPNSIGVGFEFVLRGLNLRAHTPRARTKFLAGYLHGHALTLESKLAPMSKRESNGDAVAAVGYPTIPGDRWLVERAEQDRVRHSHLLQLVPELGARATEFFDACADYLRLDGVWRRRGYSRCDRSLFAHGYQLGALLQMSDGSPESGDARSHTGERRFPGSARLTRRDARPKPPWMVWDRDLDERFPESRYLAEESGRAEIGPGLSGLDALHEREPIVSRAGLLKIAYPQTDLELEAGISNASQQEVARDGVREGLSEVERFSENTDSEGWYRRGRNLGAGYARVRLEAAPALSQDIARLRVSQIPYPSLPDEIPWIVLAVNCASAHFRLLRTTPQKASESERFFAHCSERSRRVEPETRVSRFNRPDPRSFQCGYVMGALFCSLT